jgi:hypothetical protein
MTGKGAQVVGKIHSGKVLLPPWDLIVNDITRLRLKQLFVGLAIFGGVQPPVAGKFENYDWP